MAKKRRWPKKVETALAYLQDSQTESFGAKSAPSCARAISSLVGAGKKYALGMHHMGGAHATNELLRSEVSKAGYALTQAEDKTVEICER